MAMDIKYIPFSFRPLESILFQSFMPEAESVAIPVKNLDDIPPSVAEREQMSGQRIKLKLIGHQDGQPVDRFTHISGTGSNVDL